MKHYIVLPLILLCVVCLGGVRIDGMTRAVLFLPPPLISLVLAALTLVMFARGRLLDVSAWFDARKSSVFSIANALILGTLFFATAQVFNAVLPERGLLHGVFVIFLLWSLINNMIAGVDARRTLRSLAAMLAFAFTLKFLVLANLTDDTETGVWRRAAELILKGVTLGALDLPRFAASTGYIAFFTLALYLLALWLMPGVKDSQAAAEDATTSSSTSLIKLNATRASPTTNDVLAAYHVLPASERAAVRDAVNLDTLNLAEHHRNQLTIDAPPEE